MSTWVTGTTVVENSTDATNLTSNVTITLIVGWNGGSWASDNPYYYINVNGSRVKSGTANFNTGQASSGSQTIATWTGNVPHNSDGTGSMTWAVGYEGIYAGEGNYSTASGTKTLTPIVIPDPDPPTPTPTGDGIYLDKTGLTYLWGKLKAYFVAQVSGKGLSTNDFTTAEKNKLSGIEAGAEVNAVTSVNGMTGDVIVQGGGGGGDADNNLVMLWTNPSPTANFAPQTITLSQSAEDFDILIVEALYGNWGTPCKASSIIFPASGRQKLICGQDNTGSGVGMRDITPNGTSVTFGNGHSNNASSESQSNALCIPQVIYGANIKGVGESSQLELAWTNSDPSASFGEQTITLPDEYQAVLVSCTYSAGESPQTGMGTISTLVDGYRGQVLAWNAAMTWTYGRSAQLNGTSLYFGPARYLKQNSTPASPENGYCVPKFVFGIKAVKPKKGKTLLWTNPSPTSTFSPQTITLTQDATQYDALLVETQYSITIGNKHLDYIGNSGRYSTIVPRTGTNTTYIIAWRDLVVNGNTIEISQALAKNLTTGGVDNGCAVPMNIWGVNNIDSGASTLPNYYTYSTSTTSESTIAKSYTIHGSGYISASVSVQSDATNSYGTTWATVSLNGSYVAFTQHRNPSTWATSLGANASVMIPVSDGDSLIMTCGSTKSGTKTAMYHVMAFGCSLT